MLRGAAAVAHAEGLQSLFGTANTLPPKSFLEGGEKRKQEEESVCMSVHAYMCLCHSHYT